MSDTNKLFDSEAAEILLAAIGEPETTEPEIIDIDLSVTQKKRFRINKDDSRMLELNVSDMNILTRMADAYPKLKELQEKATKISDGVELDDPESEEFGNEMKTVSERLKAVDKDMRDLVDFIFDANVSELTAPDGSMYDPFNGSPRYQHIITILMSQYENNLDTEYKKMMDMEKQMSKHTNKYAKK